MSCEEDGSSGQCYEVDPNTGNTQQTNVVSQGGNYESFAQDPDDPDVQAQFYTTEDTDDGALVRYCWFVELATEVQKIDALPNFCDTFNRPGTLLPYLPSTRTIFLIFWALLVEFMNIWSSTMLIKPLLGFPIATKRQLTPMPNIQIAKELRYATENFTLCQSLVKDATYWILTISHIP